MRTLEQAFRVQDEAVAELKQASGYSRGYTDRCDPHVARYQELTTRAVRTAGVAEGLFYRLYNARRGFGKWPDKDTAPAVQAL